MNESNHDDESYYRPRWLAPLIARAVERHPVVVLTGARQVGKSTLLRHARPVAAWPYRTLDDFDVLARAERDPESLWSGTDRVVLDEVQRVPRLLHAVKRAVDGDRRRRFVLSGSANLLLLQRVSESLAGRSVAFVLPPMALGESRGRPRPEVLSSLLEGRLPPEGEIDAEDPAGVIVRGLMPSLLAMGGEEDVLRWWEGYVATYLERDLRRLSQVDALTDFRRAMEILALRAGQVLNQSSAARDAGLSQPTAHRYLNLLEASHVVERLPAYARNRTKRLVKSPKLLWLDPALAAFLAGLHTAGALRAAREAGGLFENLVAHHVRLLAQFLVPRPRLAHWRTVAGQEVDLVLEHGKRLIAFEAKMSERPHDADAAGLRLFLEEYPEASCGLLVHAGRGIRRIDRKIAAVPWTWLAGGGAHPS